MEEQQSIGSFSERLQVRESAAMTHAIIPVDDIHDIIGIDYQNIVDSFLSLYDKGFFTDKDSDDDGESLLKLSPWALMCIIMEDNYPPGCMRMAAHILDHLPTNSYASPLRLAYMQRHVSVLKQKAERLTAENKKIRAYKEKERLDRVLEREIPLEIKQARPGFVYVLFDKTRRLCKIGRSSTPQNRLSKIVTQSGISSYKTFVSPMVLNCVDLEAAVHNKLSNYRRGGEWFACTIGRAVLVVSSLAVPVTDEELDHCRVAKDLSSKAASTGLNNLLGMWNPGGH